MCNEHTSRFLSKVIGLYLLIVSLAMLTRMQLFSHYITEFINDTPLMFLTGFFTLILGLLLVVGHNIWEWHSRVFVTIIGWLTLIKGTSLLLYPDFLVGTTLLFLKHLKVLYGAAGFDFILGAWLAYVGFKKENRL